MAIIGMDVAAVNQMGKDLTTQADQVRQITNQIDQIVRHLPAIWMGPDGRRFVDWWTGQHRQKLVAVHDAVQGLGQSATNNASEQTNASAGAGGHALAGAATGLKGGNGPGSANQPASPAAPTQVNDSGASAVNSFRAAYEGQGVDYDHAFGYQCVDLFNQYNRDVVGAPFIGHPTIDYAYQIYDTYSTDAAQFYDKIPAGQPAQPGDVAIWGPNPYSSAGHVAMVISADSSALQVIQQNGNEPTKPAYVAAHSYDYLLGYLRPKKFENSQ